MSSYEQYIIPAVISALVAAIIWVVTYVTPYIWPETYSKFILFLRKNDPTDWIEISLIISQFLRYDDWKRIVAKERLERMFKRKICVTENEQIIRWAELNENSISIPITIAISSLKNVLGLEVDPEELNNLDEEQIILKVYSEEVLANFNKNQMEKDLKDFTKIYENNGNVKLWFLIDETIPLNTKRKVGTYEKPLSTREIAVLIALNYPSVDLDGTWDTNDFLKYKLNENPPKKYNENELNDIFQNIILYLDYSQGISSKEQISIFALGLSNHEKSSETLLEMIEKIKKEIDEEELSEIRSKLRKIGYRT